MSDESWKALASSGSELFMQALSTRDGTALNRAIDLLSRAAQGIAPPNHPDRARYQSNLRAALWSRFQRTGAQADLDRAISVAQQAADATGLGDPDRPGYLSDLAAVLGTRFERTGTLADLDRAISVAQQAADATGLVEFT